MPCAIPADTLLAGFVGTGAYADCYTTTLAQPVAFPAYVEAFYTTPLFRLERLILRWFVSRPSTDDGARALAAADADRFAAWKVEGRAPDQLLLADFSGRTRSWLMVSPLDADRTRLYFGSAVVPLRHAGGAPTPGWTFTLLLGFHKLYSRALLRAARRRLLNHRP